MTSSPEVYAITGANRGLGFEFAKQLLEGGKTVIATCRSPQKAESLHGLETSHQGRLIVLPLDVMDEASVQAAAAQLEDKCPHGIDVLINNAGILSDHVTHLIMEAKDLRDVLLTNVVGTYLVTKAFLPSIRKGHKKQIVNISSTLGSISTLQKSLDAEEGSFPATLSHYHLAYRSSKAALNMQSVCMAAECRSDGILLGSMDPGWVQTETVCMAAELKKEGIMIVSINPGWVQTDMGSYTSNKMGGKVKPPLDPPTSISKQLAVFEKLTPADSGKFFDVTGDVVPW